MATGKGKTLLCAALIRRFLRTRNAERVLFIVDRIELAKQTMEDFSTVLGEFKPAPTNRSSVATCRNPRRTPRADSSSSPST
jgi:type I site-specific restriction endonuclease